MSWSQSFTANTPLSVYNTTQTSATDGGDSTAGTDFSLYINGANASLTYDLNGNMTSDGTNTYAYDAENRLVQITYPGDGNSSQFIYDGFGHCVKIDEIVDYETTSTKQFVWCEDQMGEARNGDGDLLNQFFTSGQTISGSNYFYTMDHLGSIRELTDSSGNIQAQYAYDPYGRVAQLQGSFASDFQYGGYYLHGPTGLSLTTNRAYSSNLGRWINRDPIQERGGINLYRYVSNQPSVRVDPAGLDDDYGGGLITLIPPASDWGPIGDGVVALIPIIIGAGAGAGTVGGAGSVGPGILIPLLPLLVPPSSGIGPPIPKGQVPRKRNNCEKQRIPHWAEDYPPYTGESPIEYAKRLLDWFRGEGKYKKGPKSEFNQLKKSASRAYHGD